jgi:protein gp37
MSKRLKGMGQEKYKNEFELTLHPQVLQDMKLNKQKHQFVFVNSMSDTFHKDVPLEHILFTFDMCRRWPQHTFQFLTKRAERLAELSSEIAFQLGGKWPQNIWMGVSVENSDYTFRIDYLRETGAAVKFLSLEPLLGPLDNLNLSGIDWVIAGGESGPNARPMDLSWAREIRDQCLESKIPFLFKQVGGRDSKKGGRILDGVEWNQMPPVKRSLYGIILSNKYL